MIANTQAPARYALTLLVGAGALATLAGCSSAATAGSDDAAEATSAPASTTPATTAETPAATTEGSASSAYADGTYDASGGYTSPGGKETVGVSLTLADGIVTAVTVTPESENPTGTQYQERFASGIADEVVGVALDDLDVDKVSGSSLTSTGFDAAVETIKADAAA